MMNVQVRVREMCGACRGYGQTRIQEGAQAGEWSPCAECDGGGGGGGERWVSFERLLQDNARDVLRIVERAQGDRAARR